MFLLMGERAHAKEHLIATQQCIIVMKTSTIHDVVETTVSSSCVRKGLEYLCDPTPPSRENSLWTVLLSRGDAFVPLAEVADPRGMS